MPPLVFCWIFPVSGMWQDRGRTLKISSYIKKSKKKRISPFPCHCQANNNDFFQASGYYFGSIFESIFCCQFLSRIFAPRRCGRVEVTPSMSFTSKLSGGPTGDVVYLKIESRSHLRGRLPENRVEVTPARSFAWKSVSWCSRYRTISLRIFSKDELGEVWKSYKFFVIVPLLLLKW